MNIPIEARTAEEGGPASTKPLIFFVHVPKTAGTTVNEHLRELLPLGIDHCEAFWGDNETLRVWLDTADWLSGHLPFNEVLQRIPTLTDRPVRYFTCMRNPMEQLRSTYNWIIEMYYKGDAFYDLIHPDFKYLSEVARANEKDASGIAAVLRSNSQIFSNVQFVHIVGTDLSWNLYHIRKRLMRYEMIGRPENLKDMLKCMTGLDIGELREENNSDYHFDKDVFHSKEIRHYMRRFNSRDECLYRFLFSKFGENWRSKLAYQNIET